MKKFNYFSSEDTFIVIIWDFSNPMEDLAVECSTRCLSETNGEAERVYVGVRKISNTEAKCACIPRTSMLLGLVDGTKSDGTTEPEYDAYSYLNNEPKQIGAYVYSVFSK